MSTEAPRLPMPEKLVPKASSRTLAVSVRNYFYTLYNATNARFKEMLASVGNKDAVTGNRYFDRHEAVGMIKEAATKAGDSVVSSAKDGEVYRCLVNLMRQNGLSLKLRRREYQRLSHDQQVPAE